MTRGEILLLESLFDRSRLCKSAMQRLRQRNITTFRSHMKILQEIGFVDFRDGPKGPMQYVLMRSPYKVLKQLHTDKLVSTKQYAALIERVNDIGSRDELED